MADADGGAPEAISSVPQGFSGDHVIAEWPSWLTSVAGRSSTVAHRANTFERLDKIGQGTYGNVCGICRAARSWR
ncbi:hypothetical protein PVAP13_5NG109728 [Panicum virgatum]|uniref:Uncharacterized protein n=1 Tax=Panicum virgatum TaxID=38727 RepID=A0A8T0S8X2_PANVG|nr:hypothetical protein PVAP13_5NG109728 [Panicum virgatum]